MSVMYLFYLGLFGSNIMLQGVFAIGMILSADLIARQFTSDPEDTDIDTSEQSQIFSYVVISLVTFAGLIYFSGQILPQTTLLEVEKLAVVDQPVKLQLFGLSNVLLVKLMFAQLIAVAEEEFFRRGLLNLFISRVGPIVGIVLTGFLFGIYHISVYSYSYDLLFISAGAGVILGYVSWKTGRNSASMLAHVINNTLAVLL